MEKLGTAAAEEWNFGMRLINIQYVRTSTKKNVQIFYAGRVQWINIHGNYSQGKDPNTEQEFISGRFNRSSVFFLKSTDNLKMTKN